MIKILRDVRTKQSYWHYEAIMIDVNIKLVMQLYLSASYFKVKSNVIFDILMNE